MNLPIQKIQPTQVGGHTAHGIRPVAVTVSDAHTQVVVAFFGEDDQLSSAPLGNFDLTAAEYATWGTDDSYLVDLAIQKLGLTKV